VQAYTVSGEGRIAADGSLVAEARCDDGDAVLSGGFETDAVVRSSLAVGAPMLHGWRVVALPDLGTSLIASVTCSDVAPIHEAAST
jgi:hypothetical protein